MNPQGFDHFVILDRLTDFLRDIFIFSDGYWVRAQGPLQCGDDSEPEPDISVVKGSAQDFADHPSAAILVVKVSQSALSYDRGKKSSLYARSGIPEYWIVDVQNRSVFVQRNPTADPDDPHGYRYADAETFGAGETRSPLEQPSTPLAVDDIFDNGPK